jgi:hypothetical protein
MNLIVEATGPLTELRRWRKRVARVVVLVGVGSVW